MKPYYYCSNLVGLDSAWRNRLPNDHDPVSVWSDLLTWRSHIFSAITHNFQWSEPNDLALLHDKPWTAIRMARAARKHNMKDVSCNLNDFKLLILLQINFWVC